MVTIKVYEAISAVYARLANKCLEEGTAGLEKGIVPDSIVLAVVYGLASFCKIDLVRMGI